MTLHTPTHLPSESVIVEFFEPSVLQVTLLESGAGILRTCLPLMEHTLSSRLPKGRPYYLILSLGPRKEDSLSAEDIEVLQPAMAALTEKYPCKTAYLLMNDSLAFHINRAALEPFCCDGVHRAASLSEAIRRIEDQLGLAVEFDSLPVSCC